MIYFTSDHHFGHKNIIQLCNRPFNSVEEMDEEMIRRWNETVKPEDFVYYLGDFSLSIKPVKEYVKRLNGKKILIAGNHDRCHQFQKNNLKYKYEYREMGFYDVYDCDVTHFSEDLTADLSHFPYDNGDDVRYFKLFPRDDGRWLLHGHVHNKWRVKDKMINVGVDVWDFYPVSLDKILEIMRGANK